MKFGVLLVASLLVMWCMYNQQSIEFLKIERKHLDTIYQNMKTGDLIVVTDKNYDIKTILFIYHDKIDDNVEYIIRKHNGYLQKKPINNLFNITSYRNKHLIWLPLLSPLSALESKAVDESLIKFYPNTVPINAVVKKKGQHDFIKCGDFLIKLFHDIKVVKLLKPTCYNDPINCIQQKYKNSVYLPLDEYYNITYLTILI